MTHKPFVLSNLNFVLPHKTCFADASLLIAHQDRIAVIGKNGAGKTVLLSMIMAQLPVDIKLGYVKQLPDNAGKSGAELFHRQLSVALAGDPNLLILDEPTNHLDRDNRTSLRRMLDSFAHTLIVATHDQDLLHHHFDKFAHIDDGKLTLFCGNFRDYQTRRAQEEHAIEHELSNIDKLQKKAHLALMKEQARAKSSRLMGEKSIKERKWPTIVSTAKARRAEHTSGKKKAKLRDERSALLERLAELRNAEVITPKFHFRSREKSGVIVSLRRATFGYGDSPIARNINFDIRGGERVGIVGKNASGKSTLLKALLGHEHIKREGQWLVPPTHEIGYLDQHYRNLNASACAFTTISTLRPEWTIGEIRQHLNSFLFRKNEEVKAPIVTLSGGERARLSLAAIASSSPQLLLLDEITNNIDTETREHIITALNAYRGSLIVVSHDEQLLERLELTSRKNMSELRATI